jgi:hypothetical protein
MKTSCLSYRKKAEAESEFAVTSPFLNLSGGSPDIHLAQFLMITLSLAVLGKGYASILLLMGPTL